MNQNQRQFDELKASGKLPSPTGVALRVLELARQDDTSIRDIVEVLKSDPALAGKILKVVNSSRFGLSRPTADLLHAVSHLGLKTVRQLTLGFSVVASCPRGACKDFDYEQFWQRSLATALLSDSLCARTRRFSPRDEAYTCGLLSQIGRLALATVYPKEYAELLHDLAIEDPQELAIAEHEKFLIDHNCLSAALLQDWGLAPVLVAGTQYHEQPAHKNLDEISDSCELAHVLHFAAHLADSWLSAASRRGHLMRELTACARRYQLTAEDVVSLLDEAMKDWSEWCSLFELHTPTNARLENSITELNHALHTDATHESLQQRQDVLRIVVVDDNAICLKAMQRHLSADGHQIVAAETGREALRHALDLNPHVIITDWVMPEMDGLELCRTIRDSEMGHHIYIIMVTSHTDKHRLTEAFQVGCDDFVTKPVHPEELRARIRAASRGIRLQEQLTREKAEVQQYATELSIGNRKLARDATTDALTGLPNRRYGLDRLHTAWGTACRTNRPLACLMIDIDHFKQINDTYGHPVGDAVLQQTASALNDSVGDCDVLCRFGGEEFLVICADVDETRAQLAAERIQRAIEKTSIQCVAFSGAVTISIGVSVSNAETRDAEYLLKSADDALYEAKRDGRNCVRVAGSRQNLPRRAPPATTVWQTCDLTNAGWGNHTRERGSDG